MKVLHSLSEVKPEEYCRPNDIINQYRLGKTTVYEALYKGHLRGHQVGRAWIIPRSEVERWIRGGDESAA